jgi:hypothetical protein
MLSTEAWNDPKTWISLGSLFIGACGLLYGILSSKWNRNESRMDALGKILQPLVSSAQYLHKANNQRRRCEQLKRSFVDPTKAQEAHQRIEKLIDEYAETIKEAENQLRLCESEYASRCFRFPDKVVSLLKAARIGLSEFGRLVNEGFIEQADVQFAKVLDDFESLRSYARGWRLMDPFEGIKKRFKKEEKEEPKVSRFELTQKEMDGILELLRKRATTQARNIFTVHPPQKLLDHPEIAASDKVVDELEDSVFTVVFQDGSARMMSLVELMVFTHQQICLHFQMAEMAKMMQNVRAPEATINVKVNIVVDEIMRPEMVKALLNKIAFSDVASDTPPDRESVADDGVTSVSPIL